MDNVTFTAVQYGVFCKWVYSHVDLSGSWPLALNDTFDDVMTVGVPYNVAHDMAEQFRQDHNL